MPYVGTQPIPRASRVLWETELATDQQTIDVPGGYAVGNIEVHVNGIMLHQNDFDASDGLTIDFGSQLTSGTAVRVMEIRNFEVANHYTKTEADAMFSDQFFIDNQDLSADGYQVLPGGLIIQWFGALYLASDGSNGTVITMPIAFPNNFLQATASDVGSGVNPCAVAGVNPSSVRVWGRAGRGTDTGNEYTNTTMRVLVVGY